MIDPSPEAFQDLASRYSRVPVRLTVIADGHTPITLYKALRGRGPHSFLLESVEGHRGRYSFLGFAPREVFGTRDGVPFRRQGTGRVLEAIDPLAHLRRLSRSGSVAPLDDGPPFVGGAVGYVAYSAAPLFGDVTFRDRGPSPIPQVMFMEADTVIVFDHARHTLSFITTVDVAAEGAAPKVYDQAVERLRTLQGSLRTTPVIRPLALPRPREVDFSAVRHGFDKAAFFAAVDRIKDHILAGDIFQGVLSQRFDVPLPAGDPLDVYRLLRVLNPSPYMYFLEMDDVQVIGTSPEALVQYDGRRVQIRPIAGTRKRGIDETQDRALEAELLADPKERAEHVMLVDLGRNDVGRVSRYGSVEVTQLMAVERYSHVMHIVSNVAGDLRDGLDAVDAFGAGFPAGTVTGAPKIRAMQIIDELEPTGRDLYAGSVAYFSYSGTMDSCIAIRTMVVHDGVARIQAGAGIVADSDPAAEYQETLNKARALVQAVQLAKEP